MNKVKELETQLSLGNSGLPPKQTEIEKMTSNFKRAERDREEYEQKIKELKKIIETNQTQFSNQMKNTTAKFEKTIQELVYKS